MCARTFAAVLFSALAVVAAGPSASPLAPGTEARQAAQPQTPATASQEPFKPEVGQAGKDVIWVPTPEVLVEKMLDLANVRPDDLVMDLGSGDGRNIIAAAKRGARAVGVEYNQDMVNLSTFRAQQAGIGDRATFVQGDMYEADISKATVMALFLLPSNMERLTPKFLDLAPGSRIVSNTFGIQGWTPDVTERVESDCQSWCTAHLWIVPAKVAGSWQGGDAVLTLRQDFQMLTGTLASGRSEPVAIEGRLSGAEVSFTFPNGEFSGRAQGDRLEGTLRRNGAAVPWSASRSSSQLQMF